MKTLIIFMLSICGCHLCSAYANSGSEIGDSEPRIFEKPIKEAIVNVLNKMNESVDLNAASTGAEVIRLVSIPSFQGTSRIIRVRKLLDGDAYIISKSLDIATIGGEPILEQSMRTIQADEYEYILRLMDISDLWNLTLEQDISFVDGYMTMLEVQKEDKYHRIYDVYHRSYSVGMLCDYLLELSKPRLGLEAQLWPMLAYYDIYDKICLDVTGAAIARRMSDFRTWSSNADIRDEFGDPHEVRTEPRGVRWGYYLKDRGLMVLFFDHDGLLQFNIPWIRYSEEKPPELKSEWLKSAKRRALEEWLKRQKERAIGLTPKAPIKTGRK